MLARAQVIALLRDIRARAARPCCLISHDLAAVAQLAEQVAVLYAGKLAEVGEGRDVLSAPRHPYTWGLLSAYPNMATHAT